MVTIATISIRVFELLITAMDGMMDLAINTPIQKEVRTKTLILSSAKSCL